MAHFAKLDENNIVIEVHVVNNNVLLEDGVEVPQKGIDFLNELFKETSTWVQTSYNGNIRKNYAGVGFTYDSTRDAFIPPKPSPSWSLNETTCLWDPPIPYPDDGNLYWWHEDVYQSDNTKGWILAE